MTQHKPTARYYTEADRLNVSEGLAIMDKLEKHNLSYKTGVANLQQWFPNKFYPLIPVVTLRSESAYWPELIKLNTRS